MHKMWKDYFCSNWEYEEHDRASYQAWRKLQGGQLLQTASSAKRQTVNVNYYNKLLLFSSFFILKLS